MTFLRRYTLKITARVDPRTIRPKCRPKFNHAEGVLMYTQVDQSLDYCCAVPRYYRGTAVPFFYGTSIVAFMVLFSNAIPLVPRSFGTVPVRCWHTVTTTALYFD